MSKTATKKRGRKRGSSNRMFGMRVAEAKEPLTLKLLQVDIDKAAGARPDDGPR